MRFAIIAAALTLLIGIVILVTMIYQAAICGCAPDFPLSLNQMVLTYLGVVVVSLIASWSRKP